MGVFFLKAPKGTKYWGKVELMIKHWPQIVQIINTVRPPYTYFIKPKKLERG